MCVRAPWGGGGLHFCDQKNKMEIKDRLYVTNFSCGRWSVVHKKLKEQQSKSCAWENVHVYLISLNLEFIFTAGMSLPKHVSHFV